MKKCISLVLALLIVLGGIGIINPVKAHAEQSSLQVLQGFDGYRSGEAIGSGTVVFSGSTTATAKAVPKLSGLGTGAALEINDSVERGFRDGEVPYEIFYPQNTKLSDVDSLLLYVKMPKGLADEGVSKLFINLYTTGDGGDCFSNVGDGTVKILDNQSSSWVEKKADSGILALPDQFEGYVKIYLGEMKQNAPVTFDHRTAVSTTIRFGSFGGTYGKGYIDTIWAVANDGMELEQSLQQALVMASKGKVLQSFANMAPSPVFINNSTTATATAVACRAGIEQSPSLEINDSIGKGFDDWVQFDVGLDNQPYLTGVRSILFYVKMPVIGWDGDGSAKLFFNLYTVNKNGSDEKWTNLGGGKFQYIPMNGQQWSEANATEGIVRLPEGFEGYIKVQLNNMQTNVPTEGFDSRKAIHMSFVFGSLGGNYGKAYIDAIYALSEDKGSIYLTTDGMSTYNIFNGERIPTDQQYAINQPLTPISSESDLALLGNPNRGFRLEVSLNVSNILGDGHIVPEDDPTAKLRYWHSYYAPEAVKLVQTYFYLTGYKNGDIDAYGMARMQQYFDCLRELKLKGLIRFSYQTEMDGTGEATQARMLGHMQQLKALLEANKDVIYVVQAGFIGAWGEWHSYTLPLDKTAILKGILAMTPKEIDVQVRLPEFKNLISKSDPNYMRIGIHNDSVFGEAAGGTGGVDPGTASWNQIIAESPYNPADGELFWGNWSFNSPDGRLIDGYKVIRQLGEHRFSSLSVHHNYREDGTDPQHKYSMQYWKEQEITPAWLTANGLLYAEGWFKNTSGETVQRSVFDYVRDYLGYKLEGRQFLARGSLNVNENLDVELSLVNYGFSVPFLMESGFALLDSNNQVVWKKAAGYPAQWHSHSAANPENKTLLTHKVDATIKLPQQKGTYKIAFYLQGANDEFAKLGNNLPYVNGYNVLQEIHL